MQQLCEDAPHCANTNNARKVTRSRELLPIKSLYILTCQQWVCEDCPQMVILIVAILWFAL